MTIGRSKGYRITASQRLKLGEKLRAVLAKEPDLSVKELVQRTGAPFEMCNFMRKRVREERVAREVTAAYLEETGLAP